MGPMAGLDPFMQGIAGFNEPIFGMIGPDPYGTAETASTEAFYFEDPALYDDYKLPEQESTNELQQSTSSTTNSNSTGSV